MFRFIQISENITKLTKEFKDSRKTIPWRAIAGFRNRIVHDYGKVDLNIVYDTVKIDLLELKKLFESIL